MFPDERSRTLDEIRTQVPSMTKETLTTTPEIFFSIIMIFIILIIIINNMNNMDSINSMNNINSIINMNIILII